MSNIFGDVLKWWEGVVEDVDDPMKSGRVRVRVFGYHTDDKSMLPTEDLPWAQCIMPITTAGVNSIGTTPSGLLPGSWVVGFFKDSDYAQQPIVMGSIIGRPTERPNYSRGFSDPNSYYPTSDVIGESEVSRLARNEKIDETIVKARNDSRQKNVLGALNNDLWDEPIVPYGSQYPHNKVTETESGHIFEVDDTLNYERLLRYHKSGSFDEYQPDGSRVQRIVGSNYEIISDGSKVLIKGPKTENITNNYNLKTGNNLNIEIQGNANILVYGNSVTETLGNVIQKTKGSHTISCEGNMILTAKRIDLNPASPKPSDVPGIVDDSPSLDYAIYNRLFSEKSKLMRLSKSISNTINKLPSIKSAEDKSTAISSKIQSVLKRMFGA